MSLTGKEVRNIGIEIRRPYFAKTGRLYMMDSKGRLSAPTPAQQARYGKKTRAKKATKKAAKKSRKP